MVNFSLEGKVALVTGASYGIGFALATAFARQGAKIVFNDIKQELVDKGLAAYKADSSISPVLGLNVAHRIDANWTVFGSTYMKFLSSEVKDSPMTEGKSAAWTVGAGVMYHFD